MPRGYWIAHIDVHDPEAHKAYMAANAAAFKKYGGRFLIRGGQAEVTAGASRARHVVIEFSDYATALACYHSPEYAEAIKIRVTSSNSDIIVVEGVDAV